ncbi:amino acid adenylation domain-containing protein [Mucilaginibacter sp. 21P]|uniref:non-ribosomal peptide synthetase n=1 Tax=Mucilaginibacter sp. 21P TaxID=2778902 RepID=UPI001C5A03EB|nr:non-ribosomal peptide synthetase [Mucilaginibacter sp. 21P]QXV63888.1 amino acid adenylation domain-containing protein [Mucilaginibacter sp. 21P]
MNKQLVHSRFEDIASRFGNKIAIESPGQSINYTDLNAAANKISHALTENGFSIGKIAGAYFDSSIEYVASLLGINKAGGAFMPLEPDFPVKRLVNILNDTAPQVLIAHPQQLTSLLNVIADTELKIVIERVLTVNYENEELLINVYDEKGRLLEAFDFSEDDLNIELDGNQTNYIIYTSGSTGTPKIIEGCHKGLSHFVSWQITEFDLNDAVKISQLAPLSFDVSFRDIFVPLLAGGTLCIPDKTARFQPPALLKWLISSGITLIHCVPTLFRLLTDEVLAIGKTDIALGELKYILLAGEPLFGRDVENWRNAAGCGAELVNIYGPSETTLAKMFYRVKDQSIKAASVVPLGKAISNTAIIILNDGKLCQVGEPGRIYIKTPFRTKGYYNNPGLTRERFIQNPLHNDFEDIIYDAGDLGKYLDDMNVAFLGRTDNQVKVRGNRVELVEVEKVLISYEGISAVAVVVANNENADDAMLACYYTGKKIDDTSIKNYLSNYLSQYMHPSCYVHMDSFPLNSSGKVDRKALPAPVITVKNGYEAPVNDVERKLEEIWKGVLKVPQVSRDESFFTIGGSSLKGIKIISKIYKELNVLIKLPDLFVSPTIKQLAEIIRKTNEKPYNEIPALAKKDYYDLSHAQRRLWILSHFEEQHLAYNMLYAYKFKGNLEVNALESSLKTIVDRHEIFRTVFEEVDDEPKQRVISTADFDYELNREDLRLLNDPEAKARQIAEDEFKRPFSLQFGPLFRTTLLYMPNNDYVFIFSMHHIISDGWSVNVWMKELVQLYEAYTKKQQSPLKPLRIQYKDYAAWQNNLLAEKKQSEYQAYWLKQFANPAPALDLPSDLLRPAVKTHNGRHFSCRVGSDVLTPLRQLCNKNEATLFMTLLATFKVLYFKLTGQDDITIGTPITSREHVDLEDQIGVFVNTLAFRTQFNGNDSFNQVVQKVKSVTSEGYKYQNYPFDYLIDQLQLTRDMSRSPLFDTMVVLHDNKTAGGYSINDLSGLEVGSFYVKPETTKFDINFNITEWDDYLSINAEYNRDVYSEAAMTNIFRIYLNLLEQIVQNVNKPIKQLPVVDIEMAGAIMAVNPPTRRFAGNFNLAELFELQVCMTPDNIAARDFENSLTYVELNEQANALAYNLINKQGVAVGDTVALLQDRSFNYIISALAVLKAGAAFVPVDINYPVEKISALLDDLKPKTILSLSVYANTVSGYDIVYVDEIEKATALGNPVRKINIESLAYIIYTSGSTGIPKGVAVPHSSFTNYIKWANQYYFNNERGYSFAFNTSVSFDLTITSLFTTLLRGDTIVVYDGEMDVNDTLQAIFNPGSGVDAVKLTPSHISVLQNLDLPHTDVSIVIVGGEAFHVEQALQLQMLNPEIRIFNEYGPTETTVGCTVKEVTNTNERITIGTPIANTDIYILNDDGQILPPGARGELFIAGAGVARGYYKNDLLTVTKFVDNPFNHNYSKMYASGDVGFLNFKGEFELAGRRDRQVKIHGHRIELEEIERALLKLDNISEAFVTVFKDEEGEDNMIAYHVSSVALNALEIRLALKQRLPQYMIPLYYHAIDSFQLTANGKVDAKALPNSFITKAQVSKPYVAPSNSTEKALASIWASVLNQENVGLDDDFFELGGHSLNATRIISRISKELGLRLSLKTIFTHPTIRTLALQVGISEWLHEQTQDQVAEVSADTEEVYII